MSELSVTLRDIEATRALGRALAASWGGPGCVVALEGPLGAGKTSLAKAFVATRTGLTEDDVTSPTFVLANEYAGKPGVLHIDAYRLGSPEQLDDLGFGALDALDRPVLIEWSSRVARALPQDRIEIELEHADSGRRGKVRATGPRARAALTRLENELARNGMTSLRIALAGATGRMGRAVVAAASEPGSGLEIVQALGRKSVGAEVVPGLRVTEKLAKGADIVIDFSSAEGLAHRARECAELGVPLVGCATGLDAAQHAALDEASSRIPVLYAANTSLGVTLLQKLVAQVASALGSDYDVEIVELHHKHKLDAPSGTALLLANPLLEQEPHELVHGRKGKSARKPGEIGVHALRLGDVVGEHRVYFAGPGERVELAHVATSRETFARGALRAARWLVGKPAGRYRMSEVLGLGR